MFFSCSSPGVTLADNVECVVYILRIMAKETTTHQFTRWDCLSTGKASCDVGLDQGEKISISLIVLFGTVIHGALVQIGWRLYWNKKQIYIEKVSPTNRLRIYYQKQQSNFEMKVLRSWSFTNNNVHRTWLMLEWRLLVVLIQKSNFRNSNQQRDHEGNISQSQQDQDGRLDDGPLKQTRQTVRQQPHHYNLLQLSVTHPAGQRWSPRQDTMSVVWFRCCRWDNGTQTGN